MLEVLGLILPLFGLILLGFIGAKISRQPLEALGWLNTFIIYFALPALFFKLLSKTPVKELASGTFIATNIAVTFAIFLFTYLLGKKQTKGSIPQSTIQGLAGAYGNIGYMGPAIAILVLGEKAAIPVAIIFCFENVMHFIVAPVMMGIAGQRKQKLIPFIWGIIKQVLFHPFIIATFIGVSAAYAQYQPPEPILRLIDYLAQAAAPCALFAMGVTLALRPLKRMPVALNYIVPMKLLIHPALMFFALVYMGKNDPVWVYTAVLLASLPTATNVFVLAQHYHVWVERASACIMVTTVLSVFTISILIYMIKNGYMPI